MNSISATSFYYLLIGAFFFVLFVLIYLRKTSEVMTRARFGKFIFGIIALFLLIAVIHAFRHPSTPERVRIAVLPIQEAPFSEGRSWQSWYVGAQAGQCLRRGLNETFLVYPLTWIWGAVNEDSLGAISYLQSYAERIGLDYAVLAGLTIEAERVKLDYLLVHVPSPNIIKKAQIVVADSQVIDLGRALADQVVRHLQQPRTVIQHALPSFELARWQSEAEMSLARGEYDQAILAAESALALDSSSVKSRNLLAAGWLKQSRRMEKNGESGVTVRPRALQLLEHSILLHHHADALTYRLLADYYLQEKLWDKAGQNLRKALEQNADDAEALSLYAFLHSSRFKQIGFNDEESLLRRVLFLNPCDESARLRLAELYFSRNYLKSAQKEMEALLAIHPTSVDGLMFLGKLAAVRKDFATLSGIYEKIFTVDPRNADAFYNLGIYYFQADDLGNAEKLFNRAVRLSNHLDSHLYLGQIYEQQGRIDQAIEEYRLRIRFKRGLNDRFSDVARSRLLELTKPDSSVLKPYVR